MTTKFQIFGIEVVEAWGATAHATSDCIKLNFFAGRDCEAGCVSVDISDEAARRLLLNLGEAIARRGGEA